MVSFALSAALLLSTTAVAAQQTVFQGDSQWTMFKHPIRRVAVIGGGPAGLQAAVNLLAENFTVRLFERAPSPGGNWFYSEDTPVRETYPNVTSPTIPSAPTNLPQTRYYEEGEDGIKLEFRWREHWSPRPVWYDLHANTPSTATELPGVKYPAGTPLRVSMHDIQRHVRAYASMHGLNVNDRPISPNAVPVASYSTRVESIRKSDEMSTSTWVLTLRRLEWLRESSRIKEDFWTEEFDAVVTAAGAYSTPTVPSIPGIGNWSMATDPESGRYNMHHSQAFRHPEHYAGKNVLIVGAAVSATEIARTIAPVTDRLFASVRLNPRRDAYGLDIMFSFPNKTEIVREISSFEPLGDVDQGIKKGVIRLVDGSSLTGIDEIILATGYRRNTFLPDLVDSKAMNDVYWTGHYIHDPTFAYATARAWIEGRYQTTAFARVWAGKARLPSREKMLSDYYEGKFHCFNPLDLLSMEVQRRHFIAWLNSEALEFGGKFVEPMPVEDREILAYFVNAWWKANMISHENYTRFDGTPYGEWPTCPPESQGMVFADW
ncbi:FAD/NAD-P-binding domain-containing protein [Roridomyces roridus]|uniref:FAD/NAD-P-binding domain-containing protein n=1 Tax=Roridomyces roridus TaxID=1738132 RepID=A0AAD7BDG1_9AGAR|nr:FAD/NAD-P-binding domain-containing protein [Roridomyces roridus]